MFENPRTLLKRGFVESCWQRLEQPLSYWLNARRLLVVILVTVFAFTNQSTPYVAAALLADTIHGNTEPYPHTFYSSPTKQNEADQVTIELITGQQLNTELQQITTDGLLLDGKQARLAELSQVLSIRFGRPVVVNPSAAWIALPSGGRVVAEQIELVNDQVKFKSAVLDQSLPLESIRAVIWQAHERVDAALAAPLADQDQVIVQTPDSVAVVSGLLESVDSEKLKIDYQGASRTIARDKILAIVLANLEANRERVSMGVATCQLTNGDSIVGKLLELTPEQTRIQLDPQTTVTFRTSLIDAIELVSDRLLHLTEISPTIQEQRSWFALERPWQLNRNIAGQPLKLKLVANQPPTEYGRGFGLSAFTRLGFEIPPGFDRLQAMIGIDATTADRGDCQVTILADGIRLWSNRVQGTAVAEKIDVDISNAKQLEIIVDPGQNFDLADHLNVVNPRLLKTK